jgi:16S rRNA (guanine(966)-N(2))-methyltransferase RsmD
VRIISGTYKGKTLHPGKEFKARPTTDFAKEGLFNILANRFNFEDVEVLDLFSGTGSISFEFASRGSLLCEAVELNYNHYKFIHNTAKELSLNQIKVYKLDVFRFIKNSSKKYDIIFADPPYDMEGVDQIPMLILDKLLLKPEGVFILEHSKKISFENNKNLIEHRNYGSVNFSFFS